MDWQIKYDESNCLDPSYHLCVFPQALSEFGSEVGTPIPSCSSLLEEEEDPIEASPAKGDDALVRSCLRVPITCWSPLLKGPMRLFVAILTSIVCCSTALHQEYLCHTSPIQNFIGVLIFFVLSVAFPFINRFCILAALIMWPKYWHFIIWMDFINYGSILALFKISALLMYVPDYQ